MKKNPGVTLDQLTGMLRDGLTLLFPGTIPPNIAECADLLYTVSHARISLAKQLLRLGELEGKLETKIIEELPKENASGISGKIANVRIIPFSVPQVDTEGGGWDKLWTWVKAQRGLTGFAVLGRSLNKTAVRELQDAKKILPGVKTFNGKNVSCTKI